MHERTHKGNYWVCSRQMCVSSPCALLCYVAGCNRIKARSRMLTDNTCVGGTGASRRGGRWMWANERGQAWVVSLGGQRRPVTLDASDGSKAPRSASEQRIVKIRADCLFRHAHFRTGCSSILNPAIDKPLYRHPLEHPRCRHTRVRRGRHPGTQKTAKMQAKLILQ